LGDGSLYVAAIGRRNRPGTAAPSAVIATSQGTTTITNNNAWSGPAGGVPFLAFPAGDFEQHLPDFADGAPEEIWSSRDEIV